MGDDAREDEYGEVLSPAAAVRETKQMMEQYGFREGMFPVSEEASRRLLSLPFYTALEPEDQERVVEALRSAIT